MQPTALTIKSTAGIINQLVSLVNIVVPNTTNVIQVNAIWDTGATSTVITDNIVKAAIISILNDFIFIFLNVQGIITEQSKQKCL